MKVALSLVFLAVHVQLITGFGFMIPFPMPARFQNQYGADIQIVNPQQQQMIQPFGPQMLQQTGVPIVYENQGLDENGNPFYEKSISQQSQVHFGMDPALIEQQMRQMQELQQGANIFQDMVGQMQGQEMRKQMAQQMMKNPMANMVGQMQGQEMRQQMMQNPMANMVGQMQGQEMRQQMMQNPMEDMIENILSQFMPQQNMDVFQMPEQALHGLKYNLVNSNYNQESPIESQQIGEDVYQRPEHALHGLKFNLPVESENKVFDNILDLQNFLQPEAQIDQAQETADDIQQIGEQQLNKDLLSDLEEPDMKRTGDFEFLTPESAINFNMNVRPHEAPEHGEFHFRQSKYEHEKNEHKLDDLYRQFRTEQARKIEHEKFDFALGPLVDENGVELLREESVVPRPVVSEINKMLDQEEFKTDEDDVPQIELQKLVDTKEKNYLQVVKAEALQDSLDTIQKRSDSIYIKLGQKITDQQLDGLVDAISRIAQISVEDIKDVESKNDLVKLRPESIEPEKLCTIIRTFHQAVFEENNLKFVSCGLVKPHNNKYDHNKVLFIVTIIICIGVLTVLIGLLCVFTVKRRAYLRQKLIENVSSLKPSKQKFDDVERLVQDESSSSTKRCFLKDKVWPFKTRQVSTQQSDLCRSANLSPLSSTQTTDLASRTENFESTPVVVDERKVSNRSSASS